MTVEVAAAWPTILLAPWGAIACTAMTRGRCGRLATSILGMAWCLAAVALIGLLDDPAEISLGDWMTLPGTTPIAVSMAWIITAPAAWGIAASGIALWWASENESRTDRSSPWILVQAICGVAAQAWLLDNVWWLLAAQSVLLGLCSRLICHEGLGNGRAVRSLWPAGLWAEAVFVPATLAAALSLGSFRITELSDPVGIAALESSISGAVALVGLLWWLAACGRLFQFPFSAVRDVSERSSPLVNTVLWGVALLPLTARWLLAGRWWWSNSAAVADLVCGWSVLASAAMTWCALASRSLSVRVAWLIGAQVACAVEPLVRSSWDMESLVVAQWSVSLCAAAWLFGVVRGETDEDGLIQHSPVSTTTVAPSPGGSLLTMIAVWLAAMELTGVAVWPWCGSSIPEETNALWMPAMHLGVWGLSGLATVLLAADARIVFQPARSRWGFVLLVLAPPALVLVSNADSVSRRVMESSFESRTGALMGAGGMVVGWLWCLLPPEWRRRCESLWSPLASVGRNRFSMPQLFLYGFQWPLLGLSRVCRFLEGGAISSLWSEGLRRVQHGTGGDEDLPSAGTEFYALALWLATAALVVTVMWLAS